MSRFVVTDETEHGCCHAAVVVDTSKPMMIGNKHYNGRFERVCECWNEEDAEMIAEALNKAHQQ
jgi:hypothetical protein